MIHNFYILVNNSLTRATNMNIVNRVQPVADTVGRYGMGAAV